MSIISEARSLSRSLHGEEYFAEHLEKVASLIMLTDSYRMRDDKDEILAAAYLHDVLEDTDYPVADFIAKFGEKIYIWVQAISDRKDLPNRKTKKLEVYNRTRKHSVSICLKVADRLANIQRCVKNGRDDKFQMYLKEHYTFCAALFDYRNKSMWLDMEDILGVEIVSKIYEAN